MSQQALTLYSKMYMLEGTLFYSEGHISEGKCEGMRSQIARKLVGMTVYTQLSNT